MKLARLTTAALAASLASIALLAQAAATKVEFETRDYAGYKELVAGSPSGEARIYGYLSLPANAQGKVPAAVFLAHAGGYSEAQDRWYATALNAQGIAAFFVDGYTPRGLTPPISVRTQSYATMVADAYAALAALAKRPDIDASRVALVGFSRGAEAARQAAFESFRKGAGAQALKFAAHVPFYPLCVTSMQDAKDTTGAPVLILGAANDDSTPPKNCEAYVAHMKARNAAFPVSVRVYPDADHGWDDEQYSPRNFYPRAPSAANCVPLFLGADGGFATMLKDGQEVPLERSMLRCPSAGGTLGFNAALRERSTRELVEFLKASFAAAH